MLGNASILSDALISSLRFWYLFGLINFFEVNVIAFL
jgi:hypothetical protein